jgi:hypothetical protein
MLFRSAAHLSTRLVDKMQKVRSEDNGNLVLILYTKKSADRYSPFLHASFEDVIRSPILNDHTAVQSRVQMNNVTGCLGLITCSTSLTKITCPRLLHSLKTMVIAQSIAIPRFSILVGSSIPSNAIHDESPLMQKLGHLYVYLAIAKRTSITASRAVHIRICDGAENRLEPRQYVIG